MVEFVWQTFLPVTDQTLQASFFSKTVFRFNGKLFFLFDLGGYDGSS
ncbi:hypothetical protein [Fructobacillus americanaquae]|uniref:Uncharacterized protein n=1 Tax=Fructobacillus americanaquae TaxID=2940302 RepID=A0ABY5C2K7_9LACO|nr:hypothetical protein [Fructobacillus americanaquae]USS92340.1 hypothetical protein M3M36_01615 [Fructobacillus americanaquae]